MAIDQKRLGEHVAAQMEAIEADHGEDSDAEIGTIVTIVEVVGSQGAAVRVRPSDPRPWITLGILKWAEKTLEAPERPPASE
ncbi:MAG: hypothetical protein ACHQAV_07220 [Solirubrobacterales bacterium]